MLGMNEFIVQVTNNNTKSEIRTNKCIHRRRIYQTGSKRKWSIVENLMMPFSNHKYQ